MLATENDPIISAHVDFSASEASDPSGRSASEDQGDHLAKLYKKVLASYHALLLDVSTYESLVVEKLFEEYSRLTRWGDQRRALLPSTVPSSLAAVLKDQPELASTAALIFERISELLQTGASPSPAIPQRQSS